MSTTERGNTLNNGLDPAKVDEMISACEKNDMGFIQTLLSDNVLYARQQRHKDGKSPLMAAAAGGHSGVCQLLLETGGAPWNAIDRRGQCAGNYATDAEHWDVVNLLVDAGTRAELVLAAALRAQGKRRKRGRTEQETSIDSSIVAKKKSKDENSSAIPVEHEPCSKPDYLEHRLQYTDDVLLDNDKDAVMMEWERPLMEAHAQIMMEGPNRRRVLNVGFGMGIIDTILQDKHKPDLHIIIEAHPDVHRKMIQEGWDKKPNVRVCFGRWQEVMPQLAREGVVVDAVFFDTYGEDFMDLEDFQEAMTKVLSKPHGIYSFFNGLAPDNIFFHGVACQCVKVQLQALGLESEFIPCQIQVPDDKAWEGVRRKYWHGRDTYYLPRATWIATTTTK